MVSFDSRIRSGLAILVVAVLAACTPEHPGTAPATPTLSAVGCPDPARYPGDDASRVVIARWMAHGATVAGLPAELPVMAALVESDLHNLRQPDADSVGYFQIRVGVWNQGAYAGFPDRPELQLQWFIDLAKQARQKRLASGSGDPAMDEQVWSEWIADVTRPAEQFRGRYQLRLGTARELIRTTCTAAAVADPASTTR